jgi:O-antigen/teichoic acid export membrane protein
MSLRRILKLLASFFTGQGVSIITQLLVPPFFLHRYAAGVEVYGEWIALSATVTYLNTLNSGIQTYTNNQMAIDYNRGDLVAAKSVQASALRLLLLVIGVLGAAGTSVLFMPIGRWLGLTHVGTRAASVTLYLLILQILFGMLYALLVNSYMVVGKAHRGANYISVQRLVSVLALASCVWFRASFPILALAQLSSVVLFTLVVLADLRRTDPILVPSLRYGSWKQVGAIIRPSGHFGLLTLSGFLTWQGPILLIQKVLGPSSVAVFSLSRVVFAMGRQGLAIISFSIGPEITHLIGKRSWLELRRLYDLSERVVLLLIPVFSVGMLLLSPFLFTVWLHKRTLYDPSLCFMMALISAVMGIKEHKYQFQSSSNEHEQISRFALVAYALMLVISGFLIKPFGVLSLTFVWLAAEVAQTIYILRLNVRLFPREVKISSGPVVRLFMGLAVAFAIAAYPAYASVHWPLSKVVAVAVTCTLLMSAASYYLFGLNEVRHVFQSRIRRRLIPTAGQP